MRTKCSELQLKDIDISKREAVLKHATYGSLDRDKERSNRGMFDVSWKSHLHLLRYFFNHDRKQAPGKPIQVWDDEEGAYTRVKHGTHTLGDDVLKMLDEGVIVAVSFGFNPVRQKEVKERNGKGKYVDLLQVQHLETSGLTHWGAHDESTVVSVTKDHNVDEISATVKRLESFCRNTTASDETIQLISKEVEKLNHLLINNSNTATDTLLVKCVKCSVESIPISDDMGNIKCAECGHMIKDCRTNASGNKDDVKRKMLLLKAKMALGSD